MSPGMLFPAKMKVAKLAKAVKTSFAVPASAFDSAPSSEETPEERAARKAAKAARKAVRAAKREGVDAPAAEKKRKRAATSGSDSDAPAPAAKHVKPTLERVSNAEYRKTHEIKVRRPAQRVVLHWCPAAAPAAAPPRPFAHPRARLLPRTHPLHAHEARPPGAVALLGPRRL